MERDFSSDKWIPNYAEMEALGEETEPVQAFDKADLLRKIHKSRLDLIDKIDNPKIADLFYTLGQMENTIIGTTLNESIADGCENFLRDCIE